MTTYIEINRKDHAQARVVHGESAVLETGQARLAVQKFGFSTNNISYVQFGDMMSYWDFFPAEDGWGRVPVWGFAEVVESRAQGFAEGQRFFGYWPMGDELIVEPTRIDDRGFTDGSAHRSHLAKAYNWYYNINMFSRTGDLYEAQQMLLYPLFYTGFVMDDFLFDNNDFGATQVVFSSASSKTAISTAFLCHNRGLHTVGVTSQGNVEFTKSLGIYDEVFSYEEIDKIPLAPSSYCDFSGNRHVTFDIHERLAENLKYSMMCGGTQFNESVAGIKASDTPKSAQDSSSLDIAKGNLKGPKPEFLFAPTQIAKRTTEWGREGLHDRVEEKWLLFIDNALGWLKLEDFSDESSIVKLYDDVYGGKIDPRAGYVCKLGE